ncbi:MAG: hypothetical protein ACUVX8_03155 [Candidatus Zipacnadales bacterium]
MLRKLPKHMKGACRMGAAVLLISLTSGMVFVLAASVSAQPPMCSIISVPEPLVEGQEFTVTVAYRAPDVGARLNCELKNSAHIVLQHHHEQVQGNNEATFRFVAPPATETREILIALWLGEDWRQPLAPIVHTSSLRVLSREEAEEDQRQRSAARDTLRMIGYERSEAGNIAVLQDEFPDIDRTIPSRYLEALKAAGLSACALNGEQIGNPYLLANFDALILTDARVFPAQALSAIPRFLKNGGRLVAIGGPAFTTLVAKINGQWMTRDQYIERLAQTEPTRLIFDFEEEPLPEYIRSSNQIKPSGIVKRITPGAEGSAGALHVQIDHLDGWDTMGFTVGKDVFPEGSTLTCFWAKGAPQTTQLALEWQEEDGSRWIATVPLTTKWRRYALRPTDFKYWHDSPSKGRGGPTDQLQLQRVARFSVGLAFTHTSLTPGAHEYWFDELGTAPAPLPEPEGLAGADIPIIDTLSPPYKLYPNANAITLDVSAGRAFLGDLTLPLPRNLLSCHPRPQSTGFQKARKYRWVPLIQVRGADGEVSGTLATLMLHNRDGLGSGMTLAISAADTGYAGRPEVVRTVTRLTRRMIEGVFLTEGGSEFFAYPDGENVRLGAEVMNRGRKPSGPLTVGIIVRAGDNVLFEKRLSVTVPPGESRLVETLWERGVRPGDEYTVTIRLTRDDMLVDELTHPLLIWRAKASPQYVCTRDGDFYLGNHKWYPYGVNYMPSSGIAIEDGEYFEYWLDSGPYDPAVIERDLGRIERIGFNMVSVFIYHRSIPSRNLLDLLMRCERHRLKVNLSLRPGTPLDFVWPEIGEIIQAHHLAEQDNIFAYDIAWEPAFWEYHRRKRWDEAWVEWVVERYGNIENAEADWGVPIPRIEGVPTSPSDEQVSTDGEHRVMVAAYRRFLDDLLSKWHMRAVQKIRTVDPYHLISFRMTIAGDPTASPITMGYDFGALARSMQIMEPEGYGRIGDWSRVVPGWFTVAYAHFAAPECPVMWAEFGNSVWDTVRMTQDASRLKSVAQFYRDFLEMVRRSGSQGAVCWFYPGGYRWNERSDFGIINPDGTWREITEVLHEYAPRMTADRPVSESGPFFEIDRDADARGLQGIWAAIGDDFLAAIEAGKYPVLVSSALNANSADQPVLAVGNRPYNGHNPPKYLNAEFDCFEILSANGEWVSVEQDVQEVLVDPERPVRLHVTIGNNGWATWLAPSIHGGEGGVYLATTEDSTLAIKQAIPIDVARLGTITIDDFSLEAQITAPTELTFGMLAENRAWFGEKLKVILKPNN